MLCTAAKRAVSAVGGSPAGAAAISALPLAFPSGWPAKSTSSLNDHRLRNSPSNSSRARRAKKRGCSAFPPSAARTSETPRPKLLWKSRCIRAFGYSRKVSLASRRKKPPCQPASGFCSA
ncbi:hypothetical protein BE08_00550, partial [Sorangium cellulosum]